MVRKFHERCGLASRLFLLLFMICLAQLISSCSKSNNLLFGRVEARVGSHLVIVTDCYRTTVPPPEVIRDSADIPFYHFAPCVDADVAINGDQLFVNGKSYGTISDGDTVTVDHGKVLVNGSAPSFNVTIK